MTMQRLVTETHRDGNHRIHIATFENGRMMSTETIHWDNSGKEWTTNQQYHELSYWQKAVTPEEYIKDKCARVIE